MKIQAALLSLALLLAQPVFAQDAPPAASAPAAEPAPAPAPDPSADKRLELARKMHEINPTQQQVTAAIDQIAAAQPEAERESFKTAMRSALNWKAIEKISIDAMAEIFTEEELTSMVEYYSKPEAKSARLKEKEWAGKVYPEITRMLDQAMMRVRTGGGQ